MTGITISDLTFQILSEDSDLSFFHCDRNDELGVDEFIHKEALDYQRGHYGVTYLFYYEDRLVGSVTIAMAYVETSEIPESEVDENLEIKQYPSMLIGQLGVDNDHRGIDIGTALCGWCVGKAVEFSKVVGCRYVSALTNEKIVEFYRKCGFMTRSAKKKRVLMIKRLSD